MKAPDYLAIGVGTVLLIGCTSVYSRRPVGEQPVAISAAAWEGTWLHKEGVVHVRVVDEAKGRLQVAWAEEKDDELRCESYDALLSGSGEWMFGNLRLRDDDSLDVFLWARVRKDDDQIIVWAPDAATIKRLIRDGMLPGTLKDDGDILLGDLTSEHLELITSGREGIAVEWEEPMVFWRLLK